MGTNDALRGVAEAVAESVTVPDTWGCCGFAGDRGMLHPELTASATSAQAAELATGRFDAFASCNRTCELGMTRATGAQYQHIVEVVDWASAEKIESAKNSRPDLCIACRAPPSSGPTTSGRRRGAR
jgi:D-lactate dehydrogenase